MTPAALTVTGHTRVMFILADPVAHIVGTHVLNAAFAARGFDVVVVPLQVRPEDLPVALDMIRRTENVAGAGITIPHKIAAMPFVDTLTETARDVGAVNFIRREPDGGLSGTNVDGAGFIAGLAANGVQVEGLRVVQFGAGGVGRSIAYALARAGAAELHIANRDGNRAATLAAEVRVTVPDCKVRASGIKSLSGFDLVVNTTALGMAPQDPLPHDLTGLGRRAVVAEVVMRPARTRFLDRAEAIGCRTIPGLAMMEPQAALVADFMGFGP